MQKVKDLDGEGSIFYLEEEQMCHRMYNVTTQIYKISQIELNDIRDNGNAEENAFENLDCADDKVIHNDLEALALMAEMLQNNQADVAIENMLFDQMLQESSGIDLNSDQVNEVLGWSFLEAHVDYSDFDTKYTWLERFKPLAMRNAFGYSCIHQ